MYLRIIKKDFNENCIRCRRYSKTNGIGVYSRGLIKALAGLYPGDEFHLITNDIDGAEIAKGTQVRKI